jgi:NRPS condensation-like uncharacterized protein
MSIITIQKTHTRDNWPLTFAERQMATEQSIDPNSCAYNINLAIEITGDLDIPRLERALTALVNRHTALRSYYPMENGEFIHRVTENVPVSLHKKSCTLDEIEGLIQKDDTPYDLSKAPLFRFTLYQTGGKKAILNLSVHHIIVDGVSENVITHELWQLYSGEELPPLELDYTDYAVWQSSQTDDEKGVEFFKQMFAEGMPENEMPALPPSRAGYSIRTTTTAYSWVT